MPQHLDLKAHQYSSKAAGNEIEATERSLKKHKKTHTTADSPDLPIDFIITGKEVHGYKVTPSNIDSRYK